MSAINCIKIYQYLLNHKKTTIKELSNIVKKSYRQTLRYIDILSCVVPIVTEKGSGGGVYLLNEKYYI